MTVALCMFALWAWGGWISWKGIENGNGWIGVILSEKIRKNPQRKRIIRYNEVRDYYICPMGKRCKG